MIDLDLPPNPTKGQFRNEVRKNKYRKMSERSKSFLKLCRTDGCYMKRRYCSSLCENCSKNK